jgi:hypothetical protein
MGMGWQRAISAPLASVQILMITGSRDTGLIRNRSKQELRFFAVLKNPPPIEPPQTVLFRES